MRVAFYSQHVLGVGHFFRSLEIASALAPHRVDLITGGEEVEAVLPPNVVHVPLPPLMMDAEFRNLLPGSAGGSVEEIFEIRRARLLDHMAATRPDIFLVELFPFGRKKFGAELLPVLERLRAGEFGPCRAVCSLRDILVEKADQARFEDRALRILNPLFDALLVHADPDLVRLDETFSRAPDIAPELRYTGYVTPAIDPAMGGALRTELGLEEGERLVAASAGGGAVGGELLEATVEASALLAPDQPHHLRVFTGPFMADDLFHRLSRRAEALGHVRVERFTDRFPAWLSASDLSVSMAGYNTTMNVLASGTYGLALPFAQNREQAMRARRLEERSALGLLGPDDLVPEVLAARMGQALDRKPMPHGVDLDGAAKTARILASMAERAAAGADGEAGE